MGCLRGIDAVVESDKRAGVCQIGGGHLPDTDIAYYVSFTVAVGVVSGDSARLTPFDAHIARVETVVYVSGVASRYTSGQYHLRHGNAVVELTHSNVSYVHAVADKSVVQTNDSTGGFAVGQDFTTEDAI